jgi:hypothetical protein
LSIHQPPSGCPTDSIMGTFGNIPPAEAEENYYAMMDNTKMAA